MSKFPAFSFLGLPTPCWLLAAHIWQVLSQLSSDDTCTCQIWMVFNSSPPNAAYMHRWAGSVLVQVMACRLFGTKPSPEQKLTYCQLDKKKKNSVKSKYNFLWKCIRKCHLRNGGHFVPVGWDKGNKMELYKIWYIPNREMNERNIFVTSLKRKCRHFDEILITGCTGSCHFDNFQCSQWWKFHQNEDISVSVLHPQKSFKCFCRKYMHILKTVGNFDD